MQCLRETQLEHVYKLKKFKISLIDEVTVPKY